MENEKQRVLSIAQPYSFAIISGMITIFPFKNKFNDIDKLLIHSNKAFLEKDRHLWMDFDWANHISDNISNQLKGPNESDFYMGRIIGEICRVKLKNINELSNLTGDDKKILDRSGSDNFLQFSDPKAYLVNEMIEVKGKRGIWLIDNP